MNNTNLPFSIPDTAPLNLTTYSSGEESGPVLTISLALDDDPLLVLAIPYDIVQIAFDLPNATINDTLVRSSPFAPPQELTYREATELVQETQEAIDNAITTTVRVYNLLHSP